MNDVPRLYELLNDLRDRVGGYRWLRDCSGRDGWPERGVYFFFDETESRPDGSGPRVVRVGTHALRLGGRASLWGRLRQHRGDLRGGWPGGGNHRGSVFRYHVGAALLARDGAPEDRTALWMDRGAARSSVVREAEAEHELLVSEYIGRLPFLWVGVPDEPGPASERGLIERGAIAALSSQPSAAADAWLGRHARSPLIESSGIWNVNHVGEPVPRGFLDLLEARIGAM